MKESAKSTFNPGPLQRTTPACTAGHFLLATSSGFRLAFPGLLILAVLLIGPVPSLPVAMSSAPCRFYYFSCGKRGLFHLRHHFFHFHLERFLPTHLCLLTSNAPPRTSGFHHRTMEHTAIALADVRICSLLVYLLMSYAYWVVGPVTLSFCTLFLASRCSPVSLKLLLGPST